MITMWANVKGLMLEPRDALETILARRALAVSAVLGVAGYYARTLLIGEIVFAPLGGTAAYLAGNCVIALAWVALVVSFVYTSARLTGHHSGQWLELFALWGYTQVPAIVLTVLAGSAILLIPVEWRRELDIGWIALGVGVTFLLFLWGLLLKLEAIRVWSGRRGWFRLVVVALALSGVFAWVEHVVVVERGIVPASALRAMEPSVAPFVARRDAVALPFDKLTYLIRPPHRGEIVAYVAVGLERGFLRALARVRTRFVGRVVAMPGDEVEVRNGRLYLNGVLQDEPHRVGEGRWSLAATRVQPGYYFILGDNRGIAAEEYQGGLVAADRLRGRLNDGGRMKWEFVVGKGRW